MRQASINNLVGKHFGRLIVLQYSHRSDNGLHYWLCQCECGSVAKVHSKCLSGGLTKSCGCLQKECRAAGRRTHGMSSSKEYRIWRGMIRRCVESKAVNYKRYGGRGITVCKRWRSFEVFYADMGPIPSKKHTIERKDTNGNYEPNNCYWATMKEQQRNKSTNHLITFKGETKPVVQWADDLGLTPSALYNRLNKNKWSVAKALTTPPRMAVPTSAEWPTS